MCILYEERKRDTRLTVEAEDGGAEAEASNKLVGRYQRWRLLRPLALKFFPPLLSLYPTMSV